MKVKEVPRKDCIRTWKRQISSVQTKCTSSTDNEDIKIVKDFLTLAHSWIQMETVVKKSRKGWDSEDSSGIIRKEHHQEKRSVSRDQG